MSNDKITGWIAWHPEHGCDDRTFSMRSNDLSLAHWKAAHMHGYLSPEQLAEGRKWYHYSFCLPDFAWEKAMEDGWQIREVELRFTDEEQITFANGATVELVGDGEEAFVGMDWEKKKDER